jgi:DNA-3-methyladenine glycosylase II
MKPKKFKKALEILSNSDKTLSTIIKNNGTCNLTSRKDFFNSLLEAIIGQQLSVKAADAIISRFYAHFGKNPAPNEILASPDELLRSLGFSNNKVKYIKDLSGKLLNREIILEEIDKKSDDEILNELIKVKGIGKWTVDMFLIFALGRPDVLPAGDLGLKKAIKINYKLKEMPTEEKVIKISKKKGWAPYNSLASLYLWKSLNNK